MFLIGGVIMSLNCLKSYCCFADWLKMGAAVLLNDLKFKIGLNENCAKGLMACG